MSTTDRSTDTIRDAFEAMLWFLACLIGPLRPRKITPAEEIGALAACEVETDFEPDEPPAPLLALRDLVTRAAEEHNRRALDDWHVREEAKLVRADWTPERYREARERCERATPGPWRTVDRWDGSEVRSDPGTRVIVAVDLCAEDAAFIAHAREDLPAALAEIERQARAAIVLTADAAALRSELAAAREEIERLNRLVVATANADPSWVERCTTQAAEIERLTAELAVSTAENASLMQSSLDEIGRLTTALEQRRAPAEASLEARAKDAKATYERNSGGKPAWFAVVRAVDASRPKAPTERTFPRVILGSVAPGSLIEIVSGDIGLVLDGCYGEAPRYVAWVATGHVDTMPADATVSLRATPAELDALTSADASRPGLTEEQARRDFEASIRDAVAKGGPYGNTHAREAVAALDAALLRASRGETGPAAADPPNPDRPSGLTAAMHDAARRAGLPLAAWIRAACDGAIAPAREAAR